MHLKQCTSIGFSEAVPGGVPLLSKYNCTEELFESIPTLIIYCLPVLSSHTLVGLPLLNFLDLVPRF